MEKLLIINNKNIYLVRLEGFYKYNHVIIMDP